MSGTTRQVAVYAYTEPTDMRKSFDALAAPVTGDTYSPRLCRGIVTGPRNPVPSRVPFSQLSAGPKNARQVKGLQHFITHSPWDAACVWSRVREVVPDRAGILALDDTGLPKQGKHSVGVKRQYSGTLGKVGNCQVAVSSALIGATGVWPLTCELYLPAEWLSNETRRAEVGIPTSTRFREKWRIALAHVRTVVSPGQLRADRRGRRR